MKKIYCLVFGVYFLSAVSLHAQNSSDTLRVTVKVQDNSGPDVISADRPGFSTPPSIVAKKHIQIESGFYYESDKIKNTDIKNDQYLYPTTLLRYGLFDNFELRVQVDIAGYSTNISSTKLTESGLNPVIIGTKYHICDAKKSWPEASFLFGLKLPYIGRDDFQPHYPGPQFAFLFTNAVTKKINIGYNLGMQWSGNDPSPVSFITFSPSYAVTKKLSAFGELYSYFQKGAVPDLRLDAGLAYIALSNLQLDVSAGTGLAGPLTNYFVAAGISLRLPK